MPASTPAKKSARLGFLDWTRGLAVVIMLQGHVFHSFAKAPARTQGPFMLSQFFGGIGPAIFLFLTGITLAFLMDGRERQGLGPLRRWYAALGRARYLFILAFLFRIQLFVFGYPWSPAPDLLKVDILNCMGFGIGLLATLALLRTAQRAKAAAWIGLAIAAASPLVSQVDWGWLPAPISSYFVPSYAYFAFFPWASFIAFGLSAGSLLRMATPDEIRRMMPWVALTGFGVLIGGQYFSNLPFSIYEKSEFWLNSPGQVAMKLGAILLLVSFAYVWSEYAIKDKWSWIRQFGTTSLIVYWVHIELVYGRWLGFFKENLNAIQCALCAIAVIALMLGLSIAQTNRKALLLKLSLRFPSLLSLLPRFGLAPPLASRRVSGD